MTSSLRHRGPDDRGSVVVADPRGQTSPAVLLQTRLAIIDLSPAGHQPMADEAENGAPTGSSSTAKFSITKSCMSLWRAGLPCRSRSDTEVILRASSLGRVLRQFVSRHVRLVPARFRPRDRLVLQRSARDQAFIPLSTALRRLVVRVGGSRAPGRRTGTCPPSGRSRRLGKLLAQGAVCGSNSIVEGVELLGPGESLTTDWSGKSLNARRYWSIPFAKKTEEAPGDRAEAVDRLGKILRESVRLRLIADVPLGLFLSAGIDSGALTAIATEVAGTTVETISIGFDQPEFDETEAAGIVAQVLGTRHRVVRLTGQDLLDDMPDALAAIDQPTVNGFNTYFVSRAARRAGLTVALSGLGGDELFGGYASFNDVPRALRARRRLAWTGPLQLALAGGASFGRPDGIKAAAMFGRESTPIQMYLLRRELFLPEERRSLQEPAS